MIGQLRLRRSVSQQRASISSATAVRKPAASKPYVEASRAREKADRSKLRQEHTFTPLAA